MNYRLQNADKTSGFTINTHQMCLKFDDKTPKNALKFMQKMRQIFSELSVWRLRPKFYLKKPCVSLFVVGVLRCGLEFNIKRNFVFFVAFLGIFTSALKADYTGTLPPSITLAGGKSETHKAIADCSSVWECTFGYKPPGGGYDFTYSTSGNGSSTLTLNLTLPPNPNSQKTTTPFYMNNTTINPNSNLVLNNFNSILLEYTMSITNATLTFNGNSASNSTIFQMSFKANVVLNDNATLKVKANRFLNQNKVSINNSTLDITATSVLSHNEITNNGGKVSISGNLYNVGQKEALGAASPSSVANFTNNGGTVTITGNMLNGGQLNTNTLCQISGCGGGNITINGGSMSVSGQLVSQGKDGQNSSIKIYGGKLVVGQGLQNKDGSTITFGMGNGTMGLLKGSLNNENGVVRIDMTNAKVGQSYTVLQGNLIGLQDSQVQIINNPNPDFLTAAYQNGNVYLARKGTTPPDPTKPPTPDPKPDPNDEFNKYKNSLLDNEKDIYKALANKFGNDDNELLGQVRHLKTTITETNKAIQDNLVSQPKNMLTAFKGDVLLAPMSQGRFVARRLAASGAVRFDNGRRVRALQAKPNVEFQLAPVGGVMKSADANGVLAGLSLGTNYKMGAFTHKTSLAYAYGTAKQDLSTQSTETKAHLLQAGVLSLYKYGIYETEFNANLLFGSFTIDNKWTERSLNSSSKFNNYELNLGLLAGARYGKKLSFKPFVGVQNYGQRQDGFVGILGFESKAYNAYILDGVLGVQMQYVRSAFSSVYGKVSFERRLYNTHKFVFLRSGENELKYENQSYESVVSAALGAQLLTYKRFKLNAEGFLRHYDTGLNYYGGSLVMRYGF